MFATNRSSYSSNLAALFVLCLGWFSGWVSAEDEITASHRHHAGAFIGAGAETKRDGQTHEVGIALGGEYEFKFRQNWGVGGVIEVLGADTLRDVVVAVPISFHPGAGWRLFAGPGFEFTETNDKALFRVGAGYSFHLHGHWTIVPEINGDFVQGGAQTWLGGVAFGYGF
jgi:hypothetical protein